jgi:hypothetical protein
MERASFAGMVLGITLMFLKAASYRFDVINHWRQQCQFGHLKH